MKKLLGTFLVTVMLVAVFTMPACAEVDYDISGCKYFDEIMEYNYGREPRYYTELFYHYGDEDNEEPDWTLVYTYTDDDMYEKKFGTVVNDVVLWTVGSGDLSYSRYLVYVTALDTFLRVDDRDLAQIIQECPDFAKVIEDNGFGQTIGDVDDDMRVSIMDATYIQRLLAEYEDIINARYDLVLDLRSTDLRVEFVDSIKTYYSDCYISDFDRDGRRTIFDVTAIQIKLAQLDYPVATNDEAQTK